VFVGFRLAPGGAKDYFGVEPDMITYGKSLGGGLPVGVLTGRAELMRRFKEDRPADVLLARGTFNSHPYVMGAMNVFLRRLETPEIRALYDDIDARWDGRAAALNARLEAEGLSPRSSRVHQPSASIFRAAHRQDDPPQGVGRDFAQAPDRLNGRARRHTIAPKSSPTYTRVSRCAGAPLGECEK
jgi:glutamate-1-semialdehyde aminotransferase